MCNYPRDFVHPPFEFSVNEKGEATIDALKPPEYADECIVKIREYLNRHNLSRIEIKKDGGRIVIRVSNKKESEFIMALLNIDLNSDNSFTA